MDDAPHSGLSYKGHDTQVDASQETVNQVAQAFGQLLQHPFVCFGILALIGFWIWDRNRTRVKLEHLKQDYGTARFMAQQQYSLPLGDNQKPRPSLEDKP